MWVIILQLLLLRQANLRHLGNNLYHHHHCNEVNSQKGASTLTNNETSGRSPKLAQSTILCQNRSISTKRYPTSETVLAFVIIFFFNKEQSLKDYLFCCFQSLVIASLLPWYNIPSSQTHEVPKVGEVRKLFSSEREVHNHITSFAEATKVVLRNAA
jgi:hypothetical protein